MSRLSSVASSHKEQATYANTVVSLKMGRKPFHIDHIKPLAADGQTVAENLALACVSCSL